MVKVSGPAFSMDASGSIGGVMTFSKWKGRNYIRALVKPSNPKSGGQVGVRAMFKFLTQIWAGLTDGNKATWEARAEDGKFSPFNAFVSYNQKRWRDFDTPTIEDPAAEAATAPSLMTGTATPDVRSMTLEMTHGAEIADWGVAIFRQITTPVVPSFSNCIAVVEVDGSGDAEYIDTPLEAGQYYYMTIGFMIDGTEGADGTEFNGTVV